MTKDDLRMASAQAEASMHAAREALRRADADMQSLAGILLRIASGEQVTE